jgi:multisubunit Na+/H+ antiporter MnhF subunit
MSTVRFTWGAALLESSPLYMFGRLIAGPTHPDRVVALDA